MRGEYTTDPAGDKLKAELPPRARRIPRLMVRILNLVGTTSACAENTTRRRMLGSCFWNYLRVRGEYGVASSAVPSSVELPPRARRIHRKRDLVEFYGGTTSACAENTRRLRSRPRFGWNYLRVRGEYACGTLLSPGNRELPPRARRIQQVFCGEEHD